MSLSADTILQVRNLHVSFSTDEGLVPVVRGLSYTLPKGRVLAVVGESGSGKTVQALSVLRLLASNARIAGGKILFKGEDLLSVSAERLRRVRGAEIAMIFQDPSSSLNPVMKVGEQIAQTILAHRRISKERARARAINLLKKVGIENPRERYHDYPFQFSGGMCQRVMIAMALALSPDVLIADEPTTALDVTIQAQILRLIKKLQRQTGLSALFITHNLALVPEVADDVLVLYGGQCMEQAPVRELFARPLHPYTRGLLASLVNIRKKEDTLPAIAGTPPLPGHAGDGCPFAPRCKYAMEKCFSSQPPSVCQDGHIVKCWLAEEK